MDAYGAGDTPDYALWEAMGEVTRPSLRKRAG
jgi:hypothetical protein